MSSNLTIRPILKIEKFMEYKQQKYIRQKLDLNRIMSNSSFFMVLQIKSIGIFQWISLKKRLINLDIKIKSSSIKILKNKTFLPYFINKKILNNIINIFNGKTILLYSNRENFFFPKNCFLINLFTYFKNRFLPICLLKKKISNGIKIEIFKFIFFLKRFITNNKPVQKLLFLIDNIK